MDLTKEQCWAPLGKTRARTASQAASRRMCSLSSVAQPGCSAPHTTAVSQWHCSALAPLTQFERIRLFGPIWKLEFNLVNQNLDFLQNFAAFTWTSRNHTYLCVWSKRHWVEGYWIMREKIDYDLVISSPTTFTSLKLHCFDAVICCTPLYCCLLAMPSICSKEQQTLKSF